MEKWRSALGFDGMYEVSNEGRVRSVARRVKHARHGFVSVRERILKPAEDGNGYLRVALSDGKGNLITKKVHRLVAECFVDGDNSLEVHHKDGVKDNNHASNLSFVTRSENIKENYALGIQKPARGESNGNSKLTQEQVDMIRSDYKPYEFGLKRTADKYGISKRTVLDIINRRIWK